MFDLYSKITDIYFEGYADKFNTKESLDKFYNSFTSEELVKFINSARLNRDDLLLRLDKYKEKSKKESINYIINNFEDFYTSIIGFFDEELLAQLKYIINEMNNGYLKLNLTNMKYSISFIMKIRNVLMAKLNYDKNTKTLEVFIPQEIVKIALIVVNDRKTKRRAKEYSEIKYNIDCILSPYGVLNLDTLYNCYIDYFKDVGYNKLLNTILVSVVTDDEVNYVTYEDNMFVCNVSFKEEDVKTFIKNKNSKLKYKKFNRDDLIALKEGDYYCRFQEYDELIDTLFDIFDFNEDELDKFLDSFVLDYMFTFVLNEHKARENLDNNITKCFSNLGIIDRATIMMKVNNLAKNYPMYKYNGYSINEMKSKEVAVK